MKDEFRQLAAEHVHPEPVAGRRFRFLREGLWRESSAPHTKYRAGHGELVTLRRLFRSRSSAFFATVACIALLLAGCHRAPRPVPKPVSVAVDLTKPTDYSGIPPAKWFPMGGYEFCAIQGNVSADVLLPDGQRISEKCSIVYVDRDADGIIRVRTDSPNGALSHQRAPGRLRAELQKWGDHVLAPSELAQKEATILMWMKSDFSQREMWEHFSVQRTGYRITLGFCSTYLTHAQGFGYAYQVHLREESHRRKRDRLTPAPPASPPGGTAPAPGEFAAPDR